MIQKNNSNKANHNNKNSNYQMKNNKSKMNNSDQDKPKELRPCCACKETREIRDECLRIKDDQEC